MLLIYLKEKIPKEENILQSSSMFKKNYRRY